MLAGFIFPGIFVAPATIAVTVCAVLPDHRWRLGRVAPPRMTRERAVLRAAVTMSFVGVASLLFWVEADTSPSEPVRPTPNVTTGQPYNSGGFVVDYSCTRRDVTPTCTALMSAARDLVIPFFLSDIDGVPITPNADGGFYETTLHGAYDAPVSFAAGAMESQLNGWHMLEGDLTTGRFVATRQGDGYPTRTARIQMEPAGDETVVHIHITAPVQPQTVAS